MVRLPLALKIYVPLLLVFGVVLAVSANYTQERQQKLVEDLMQRQIENTANSYFDSINMMMLTGAMHNRKIMQEKTLSSPGVLEARIVRAAALNAVFGEGFPDERAMDAWDEQALQGQEVLTQHTLNDERQLTLIKPLYAWKDYHGTNCQTCHIASEDTVLGAVRVSYSLAEIDERIRNDVNDSLRMQITLFAIGFGIVALILTFAVVRPVKRLSRTMKHIEHHADLSQRVPARSVIGDEITMLSRSFNEMLHQFQNILQQVQHTTGELRDSALHIAEVSGTTLQAVNDQNTGTESVAAAMNEMEASCGQIKQQAEATASVSHEANQQSNSGVKLTHEAKVAIETLVQEMSAASASMAELGKRTNDVERVLELIRDIAKQTNMLAVNAGIEAARVGAAGKGFAVVADEVQKLAVQTDQATNEIHQMLEKLQLGAQDAMQMIHAAQAQADLGNERMQQTEQALSDIASFVNDINQRNAHMAGASDEQTLAAGEINDNVARISDLAQRTSQDAADAARTGKRLQELAEELGRMVGAFRI